MTKRNSFVAHLLNLSRLPSVNSFISVPTRNIRIITIVMKLYKYLLHLVSRRLLKKQIRCFVRDFLLDFG